MHTALTAPRMQPAKAVPLGRDIPSCNKLSSEVASEKHGTSKYLSTVKEDITEKKMKKEVKEKNVCVTKPLKQSLQKERCNTLDNEDIEVVGETKGNVQ